MSHDQGSNPALDALHEETFSKTVFGFWVYLMTDCLLFATLFCTYGVLHQGVAKGPGPQEIFSLKTAFIETMILLFSSVACGMALLQTFKKQAVARVIFWLALSFCLGASFVFIELSEFYGLIQEGNSFQTSAFLSSYFTLVGTHGLHVSFGLIWLIVMILQLIFLGLTLETFRRLVVFNLFWHFLDLVWIFIFTFVYLLGVI